MTPRRSGDQRIASKENVVNDTELVVNPQEETHEYLSGLKLFVVMLCITLQGFLLLLDTSVLSTVSLHILSLYSV